MSFHALRTIRWSRSRLRGQRQQHDAVGLEALTERTTASVWDASSACRRSRAIRALVQRFFERTRLRLGLARELGRAADLVVDRPRGRRAGGPGARQRPRMKPARVDRGIANRSRRKGCTASSDSGPPRLNRMMAIFTRSRSPGGRLPVTHDLDQFARCSGVVRHDAVAQDEDEGAVAELVEDARASRSSAPPPATDISGSRLPAGRYAAAARAPPMGADAGVDRQRRRRRHCGDTSRSPDPPLLRKGDDRRLEHGARLRHGRYRRSGRATEAEELLLGEYALPSVPEQGYGVGAGVEDLVDEIRLHHQPKPHRSAGRRTARRQDPALHLGVVADRRPSIMYRRARTVYGQSPAQPAVGRGSSGAIRCIALETGASFGRRARAGVGEVADEVQRLELGTLALLETRIFWRSASGHDQGMSEEDERPSTERGTPTA